MLATVIPVQALVAMNSAFPRLTPDERRTPSVEVRLERRAPLLGPGLSHLRALAPPFLGVRGRAKRVGVTVRTVHKWRQWGQQPFEEGIAGLYARPRSGRPPHFSPEQRCEVIAVACDAPANHGLDDFHLEEDLRNRVLAFIERWNAVEGHPFNWTFQAYPMQEKAMA